MADGGGRTRWSSQENFHGARWRAATKWPGWTELRVHGASTLRGEWLKMVMVKFAVQATLAMFEGKNLLAVLLCIANMNL